MKTFTFALVLLLSGTTAQANDFERLLDKLNRHAGQKTAMASPPQTKPADTGKPPDARDQLLQAILNGKTSPAEERRIGERIAGNFLGAVKLVPDDALQRYVNLVGNWVARQGERPDLAWRFGVVDSEDINAFAAPGGFIFITKGLYRQLDNEADLAGVLGHEIGHVLKKHHLKVMQKSKVVAAASALLGKKIQSEEQTIQNLIGNGAEILSRSLDKEAEFEADRIGMVLAARAGYDVYALPKVLELLGHASDKDSRLALLYKTHPSPADRFAHLGEAAGDRLDDLPEGKTLESRFIRLP